MIAGFLLECLVCVLIYLAMVVANYVLLPVVLVVCTPFILVIALFCRARYGEAVSDLYFAVYRLWTRGTT